MTYRVSPCDSWKWTSILVLRRPIERAGFMRTYASSSRHIVDAVSIWSIATLLTRKILDSLSPSPVQQFSVTLWPSARLNHDYTFSWVILLAFPNASKTHPSQNDLPESKDSVRIPPVSCVDFVRSSWLLWRHSPQSPTRFDRPPSTRAQNAGLLPLRPRRATAQGRA